MTQDIEPSNLKSFQRISPEDLRYLKELGQEIALARTPDKPQQSGCRINVLELLLDPKKLRRICRVLLDRVLYETVPVSQVYASRE
jgi:hypothetical protein